MDPTQQTNTGVEGSNGAAPAAPPAAPQQNAPAGAPPAAASTATPAPEAAPVATPAPAAKKPVHYVPESAMKEIKLKERRRGQAELAKELGFASVEEMTEALKRAKPAAAPEATPPAQVAPATPPATPPAPQAQQQQLGERDLRAEREAREERIRVQKLDTARKQAEARAQQAEEALQAERARISLEKLAMKKEIQYPSFAINQLIEHTQNLSEEDLAKFDEGAFFDKLLEEMPFLKGSRTVPATTGPGTGTAPAPLKPGQIPTAAAEQGKKDINTMTRQEYKEYQARRGLKVTG